ncbi:MAG: FAD-dependent oxidoreductase [Candidatus Pelagibacter sp.]|nr:FAD-dependent oxidoreductase [Candidatus Pelagibacter sp.]
MQSFDIDYLVIGGGVAGLAVAAKLSSMGKEVILVEKNNLLAQETSSRNSEVIHAGIYYEEGSLKSELCILGKELLYQYLDLHSIPYTKCGKFIVATSTAEEKKLLDIYENGMKCGVTDLVLNHESIASYKFLNYEASIYSPSTGIFDSYSFVNSLKNDFADNKGILLLGNEMKTINQKGSSFEVLIDDLNNKTEFLLKTKKIINAAGLRAHNIINHLSGKKSFKPNYKKGEYYSYTGKEKLNHLIYPIPGKYSLGIHATIDLGQGIRFGPSSYDVSDLDYEISYSQRHKFYNSIKSYWPSIAIEDLVPTYSGIRPLLEGCEDFLIDTQIFDSNVILSILGYASPGLTSSLALAERVSDQIIQF